MDPDSNQWILAWDLPLCQLVRTVLPLLLVQPALHINISELQRTSAKYIRNVNLNPAVLQNRNYYFRIRAIYPTFQVITDPDPSFQVVPESDPILIFFVEFSQEFRS